MKLETLIRSVPLVFVSGSGLLHPLVAWVSDQPQGGVDRDDAGAVDPQRAVQLVARNRVRGLHRGPTGCVTHSLRNAKLSGPSRSVDHPADKTTMDTLSGIGPNGVAVGNNPAVRASKLTRTFHLDRVHTPTQCV